MRFFALLTGCCAVLTIFSTLVNAGEVDISNSDIIVVNENTLRISGIKHALFPDEAITADFIFNENTLSFELDAASVIRISDNRNMLLKSERIFNSTETLCNHFSAVPVRKGD